MISLIAAVGQNRVIGVAGDLPWHLSGDLKFFKQTTMGKPIIMGRKTFDSIGKALPGRPNIVVTRNPDLKIEGIDCVRSLDEGLAIAKKYARDLLVDEIMVIGGAQIYSAAIAQARRLYITEVALSPDGDAFFPDYSDGNWTEITREEVKSGNDDSPDFSFVTLERTT